MIIDSLMLIAIPLFLTGLLSGFLAGLLGIGGGLVIVPILAYLLVWTGINDSFPMHIAIATSLAIIVPTSILSARSHMKLGNVDFSALRQLAPCVFFGALGGGLIADGLDNASLKVVFGALAIILSASFFVKIIIIRQGLPKQPVPAAIGAVIGLLSALVGIGGGSMVVPTLTAFGWNVHRAVGSAAMMGLVISVPGMFGFILAGADLAGRPPLSVGYVYLPAAAIVILAAFFTAPLGARIASRINKDRLRRIFAVFLMIVGARLIYDGSTALGWLAQI